jgi:hypothetical protein
MTHKSDISSLPSSDPDFGAGANGRLDFIYDSMAT